ncbi:MAG: hypothetical protein DGJ47_000743 [Rickettsiaceae bacterium]
MAFNKDYMRLALKQAEKAYDHKEVPVGCVIVQNDNVISQAHNLVQTHRNPTFHAEMLAINKACEFLDSKNLADCDLYVTLEPCTMCVSAIANARVKRLYYSVSDDKQGAVENGVQFFSSSSCFHKPEIYSEIMHEESRVLLQKFFRNLR